MKTADNEEWRLTPWGCMYEVLRDYGFDPKQLTPKMGEHMVEDFMKMMVRVGHVGKVGEDERFDR